MKNHLLLKQATAMVLSIMLILTAIPMVMSAESTNLYGKKLLVSGDSIASGWRDTAYEKSDYHNGGGWAARLENDYGMTVTKAAVAGQSLTVIENRGHIVQQLHNNKNNDYDYVLLQGGFNDAMGENKKGADYDNPEVAPYGEVSNSANVEDFNTDTFAGALEELFYYAKQYFPSAQIGFIITYQTPQSQYGGRTADVDAMRLQWNIAKEACKKWDIVCLDLFDGITASGESYSNLLDSNNINSPNFPGNGDNIHLSTAGYDLVTPYIAEWMQTDMQSDTQLDWEEVPDLSLDFEDTYLDSNGNPYYDNTAENWSAGNGRGSKAEAVTEADGNNAVRLTYDGENNNENYNANAVLNIYNPETKSKFVGTEGVTYTVSFDYKVEQTDGQALQLFIAPSNREQGYPYRNYAFQDTDMGPKAVMPNRETAFTEASGVITETTQGWVHTSVEYTAMAPVGGHTTYPIILLQTNGKVTSASTKGNYASVLIDNIKIELPKRALITCYNYDGSDKAFYIYDNTLFADLNTPSRRGWIFEGWYTDSEYTQKAADNELVGNYGAIYAKWSGDGDAMTPYKITDSINVDIKNVSSCTLSGSELNQISYVRNSMIDAAGSASVSDFYGSYVFSSEITVANSNEKFIIDNIQFTNPTSNTVMFYVELPDFEKSGAEWGLALGNRGICIYQNSNWIWTNISAGINRFDYCLNNKWVESTLSSEGVFTGLPSGYKRYIRIDLSALTYKNTVDFTGEYNTFVCGVFSGVLGTRNNLAVKVRYRLGSRNC